MTRRKQRGSAMIEAALIFSLLLAILIGLADAGRRLLAQHFACYAAREATRYAEVHGARSAHPATRESIEGYVKRLAMAVDPGEIRVETAWAPDNRPGSTVRIKVEAAGAQATSEVAVLH